MHDDFEPWNVAAMTHPSRQGSVASTQVFLSIVKQIVSGTLKSSDSLCSQEFFVGLSHSSSAIVDADILFGFGTL